MSSGVVQDGLNWQESFNTSNVNQEAERIECGYPFLLSKHLFLTL